MLASVLFLSAMTQVSVTPAERLGEQWWKTRHENSVAATKKGGYDLMFIGDSITQGWEGQGKPVWDKYYANRKAVNFGFSGDRTEHVLWRMDNGEMMGLKPKVTVIMIGTNNIGHGSSNAVDTATGVKKIVARLHDNMPETKILLLGIFPRGADAQDRMRIAVAQATDGFKGLADDKSVFFMDVSKYYMSRSGDLWKSMMPDLLHPNTTGYEIWAKAMEPTLKSLLGEK